MTLREALDVTIKTCEEQERDHSYPIGGHRPTLAKQIAGTKFRETDLYPGTGILSIVANERMDTLAAREKP